MDRKLISIEGLDGSGKTTQTELLCRDLENRGVRFRHVSFPNYGEPYSAPVRMYLGGAFGAGPGDVNAYAASSFFAVDRFASFSTDWKKDYQNGTPIVADRYTTSNIVYQLPKLPKEEWNGFIDWIQDYEYEKLGLPRPDLTIYLDMPASVSRELLGIRYHGDEGKEDIHERNESYLSSCRESAVYAAGLLGWRVVACAESGRPKEVGRIHDEIIKILAEELPFYV